MYMHMSSETAEKKSPSKLFTLPRHPVGIIILGFLVCAFCMPFLLGLARRAFTTMASQYTPGTMSMAFVTVPDMDVARKIAGGLVKNKLAACVNVLPGVTSIYEWQDKIEEDSELLLMIKTRTSRVDDVSTFVKENHPNDVCEVISSPIQNGNEPYLKWVGDTVPEK